MQNFRTLGQPLLGQSNPSGKKEREQTLLIEATTFTHALCSDQKEVANLTAVNPDILAWMIQLDRVATVCCTWWENVPENSDTE